MHEELGNGFEALWLCVTNTLQSQLCEKSIFQNDRNTAQISRMSPYGSAMLI